MLIVGIVHDSAKKKGAIFQRNEVSDLFGFWFLVGVCLFVWGLGWGGCWPVFHVPRWKGHINKETQDQRPPIKHHPPTGHITSP